MKIPQNCVLFAYPKMGQSGKYLPENLANLAGLTGCTNQCKAYENELEAIRKLGFEIVAIGSQSKAEMAEFKQSVGASFEFICDENFTFEKKLDLQTFATLDGKKFYHRQTLILKNGEIIKRFDQIAKPEDDARNVIEFLKTL